MRGLILFPLVSCASALDTNNFKLTLSIQSRVARPGFPVPYQEYSFSATIPPATSFTIPQALGPLQGTFLDPRSDKYPNCHAGMSHTDFFAYTTPNVFKFSCAQSAQNVVAAYITQGDGQGPWFRWKDSNCYSSGLVVGSVGPGCQLWSVPSCIASAVGNADLTSSFVAQQVDLRFEGYHWRLGQDLFHVSDFSVSLSCTRVLDCKNGGHTVGLQCVCAAGYYGEACEVPCTFGGVYNSSKDQCVCKKDYYGADCGKLCGCHIGARCKDGHDGDGSCMCNQEELFFGDDPAHCFFCNTTGGTPNATSCACKPDVYGPGCSLRCECPPNTYCEAGQQGDGSCHCDELQYWYGTDARSCKYCAPVGGLWDEYDLVCRCKKRYSGPSCEIYTPPALKTIVRSMSDFHFGSPWFKSPQNFAAVLRFFKEMASDQSPVGVLVLNGDLFDYWMTRMKDVPLTPEQVLSSHNLYGINMTALVVALQEVADAGVDVIWVVSGNHDLSQNSYLVRAIGGGRENVKFRGDELVYKGVVYTHGHLRDLFNTINPDPRQPPVGYYVSRLAATSGYQMDYELPWSIQGFFARWLYDNFPDATCDWLIDHPYWWKVTLSGVMKTAAMAGGRDIDHDVFNDGGGQFPSVHEIIYRYSRLLRSFLKDTSLSRSQICDWLALAKDGNQDSWARELSATRGVHYIVMGHTHVPLVHVLGSRDRSHADILFNSGCWCDNCRRHYVDVHYDFLSEQPTSIQLKSYPLQSGRQLLEKPIAAGNVAPLFYAPQTSTILSRILLVNNASRWYMSFDQAPVQAVSCPQTNALTSRQQDNLVTLAILARAQPAQPVLLSEPVSVEPPSETRHVVFCDQRWWIAPGNGWLFSNKSNEHLSYLSPGNSTNNVLHLAEFWSTRDSLLPQAESSNLDLLSGWLQCPNTSAAPKVCVYDSTPHEASASSLLQSLAPLGWICAPFQYNASDGCHCGCGVQDPDCDASNVSLLVGCDEHPHRNEEGAWIAWCTQGLCQYQKTPPPDWTCAPEAFNSLDGCHCECGAYDPDCDYFNQTLHCKLSSNNAVNVKPQSCLKVNSSCVYEPVKPETLRDWTCPLEAYGSGDGCDCNCGMYDPDCAVSQSVMGTCPPCNQSEARCTTQGTCTCLTAAASENSANGSPLSVLGTVLLILFGLLLLVCHCLFLARKLRKKNHERKFTNYQTLEN